MPLPLPLVISASSNGPSGTHVQPAGPSNGYSLGELPAFPRAQRAVEAALALGAPPARRGIFGLVRRNTNPAARLARTSEMAAQLRATLERAIRENWAPAEFNYVEQVAIKVHEALGLPLQITRRPNEPAPAAESPHLIPAEPEPANAHLAEAQPQPEPEQPPQPDHVQAAPSQVAVTPTPQDDLEAPPPSKLADAVTSRIALSRDLKLSAFERAAHLQWCVEAYDASKSPDANREFVADLARQASRLYLQSFDSSEHTALAALRAARMDHLALAFGAPQDPDLQALDRRVRVLFDRTDPRAELERDLPFTPAETASIESGLSPWPALGRNNWWITTHLNHTARAIDRLLLELNDQQRPKTMTDLATGLAASLNLLQFSPAFDEHFAPILRARLIRGLQAVESSEGNETARNFVRMAFDLCFPEGRNPSIELMLAVRKELAASNDWSYSARLILRALAIRAMALPSDELQQAALEMLTWCDAHIVDHEGGGANLRNSALPGALEELRVQRGAAAHQHLQEHLPPQVSGLVLDMGVGPPSLANHKYHFEAAGKQPKHFRRAIDDFVTPISNRLASDYARGELLLRYGQLHLRFAREAYHPSIATRSRIELGKGIAALRDSHSEPAMRLLLDEALAVFSPANAKGSHDLAAVLLRAGDGFIEAASMPAGTDSALQQRKFVDSWKVLFDRVDNCDIAGKEKLRADLLNKLMAFAREHPRSAGWVREALIHSRVDNEARLRVLWRLETPARLMADADKAIKDLVDGKSSTAKFGNKWKELRDEVEKFDREEWDGLRAPLLARLRAFAAENDEQTESIHAARLSFAPTPVPPPRSFRQP